MIKLQYYILIIIFFHNLLSHNFIFHNHEITMETIKNIIIKKEKGAYLRTGDGDVFLANGLKSGTHAVNSSIQFEMKQVFKMEGKNLIKSLPFPPHPFSYKLKPDYFTKIFKFAEKIWGNDLNVYSAVFLHHYSVSDIDKCLLFLKFLKESNCSLLIGDEKIPDNIKKLFFGEHCQHLKTPTKNPYNYINTIEEKSLELIKSLDKNKFHVLIMSLGNTGRVLIKRIYNKIGDNVFFFDFGSLMDAICKNGSRGWIRKYFNYEKFMKAVPKYL